ncbi:MAG: HAD family hydrolase [Actinobacteria bacterium]|nr:HAD family hydrolase [Actinomycetota bacterium]
MTRAACTGALLEMGQHVSGEAAGAMIGEFLRIAAELWHRSALGPVTLSERFEQTLKRHGIKHEADAGSVAETYIRHWHDGVVFLPGGARLLRAATRFHTGLITNGNAARQRETAKRLGVLAAVDHVLISGELGVSKPDPAIFWLALEKAGCAPDEAVMVGDSLPADMAGAQALGIRTLWIDHRGQSADRTAAVPDVVVTSAEEAAKQLELVKPWSRS